MKVSELKNKSTDELEKSLTDLLKDQLKLRMQKGMGETPRTHQFKQIRRDIARIHTVLNEKRRQAS